MVFYNKVVSFIVVYSRDYQLFFFVEGNQLKEFRKFSGALKIVYNMSLFTESNDIIHTFN